LVVVAYLDESGTHGSSTCTVVAGYAGLQERWLEFEKDWREITGRYGVTVVHGIELAIFKKRFRDWNDARRTDFLSEIGALVTKHQLLGVNACLINRDYEEAYRNLPKRIQIDSKYAHCFRCCMIKIGSFVREQLPGVRARYVLEDGHKNKGDALRLFELSKQSETSRRRWPLHDIRFASKEDYGALQLADLLAYSAYRYTTAYVAAGNRYVEPHKNLVTIWESSPHIDILITREEMEHTALQLERIVREYGGKSGNNRASQA
jgi:hypothetical protein